MRINQRTALVGNSVVLVPYRSEHVQTYHRWMTDPNLLKLTASEPLTLEQEFEMQQKWRVDDDKLTFIVLARPPTSLPNNTQSPEMNENDIKDCPMIGDVNLFFNRNPLLPIEESPGDELEVECEVMIAEPAYRRKGLALAALKLLLNYASSPSQPLKISPRHFLARISATNEPSISLFSKLGFVKSKYVEVFDELELRWCHDAEWLDDTERVGTERVKWWGCEMQVIEYNG
ncbi:hypothetical protein FRC03_011146 [Tulasnella sp. 419]|nr:hypothetical protein FRC02_009251 [Tulasnella sp. 418]KAG8970128.1 hypothetical protein FRC03_011146 [Tulasnella sp. 419]